MLGILRGLCPWLSVPAWVAWKEILQLDSEDDKLALKAPEGVGSAKRIAGC